MALSPSPPGQTRAGTSATRSLQRRRRSLIAMRKIASTRCPTESAQRTTRRRPHREQHSTSRSPRIHQQTSAPSKCDTNPCAPCPRQALPPVAMLKEARRCRGLLLGRRPEWLRLLLPLLLQLPLPLLQLPLPLPLPLPSQNPPVRQQMRWRGCASKISCCAKSWSALSGSRWRRKQRPTPLRSGGRSRSCKTICKARPSEKRLRRSQFFHFRV
mmetsp:Transcript_31529/g.75534  ORF Transcript_31529/g.75534 Transcript_31529/m.75534 type:complete len:214 (-) Transcript_31529:70-711(-)